MPRIYAAHVCVSSSAYSCSAHFKTPPRRGWQAVDKEKEGRPVGWSSFFFCRTQGVVHAVAHEYYSTISQPVKG